LSKPDDKAITTHYGFYEDAYLSSRSKITIFFMRGKPRGIYPLRIKKTKKLPFKNAIFEG